MPAKQVDSKVSMLKRGSNWIISASGGVAIYAPGLVAKAEQSDALAATRSKLAPRDVAACAWN